MIKRRVNTYHHHCLSVGLLTLFFFVLLPSTAHAQASMSIDFENQTLGSLTTRGNMPWQVVNTAAAGGAWSAGAGKITSNQKSILEFSVTIPNGGQLLRFSRRVSSESGYDYLTFFNDNASVKAWSGSETSFTTENYSLTAGQHTLRWEYSKDGSVDQWNDTAWIDDIQLLPPPPPPATGMKPLWGYAWSPNIGWIQFGTSASDSLVTWNADAETVSGYAWSPNIGWIFTAPTGQPTSPYTGLKINKSTGDVSGWMRVQSLADVQSDASKHGGWNGWMKTVTVKLDRQTGLFSGYAWSDNLGWIDFRPSGGGVRTLEEVKPDQKPATPELLNPLDGGLYKDYSGICLEQIPEPVFQWSAYSDPDGDLQTSYTIEFRDTNAGAWGGASMSAAVPVGQPLSQCTWPCGTTFLLDFNKEYEWRVRVSNAKATSDPSVPRKIRTAKHARPQVSFTVMPERPPARTDALFKSTTQCQGVLCTKYFWKFGDGTLDTTTTLPQTTHRYDQSGSREVWHEVTDADEYKGCAKQTIQVGSQLPEWEKITPF